MSKDHASKIWYFKLVSEIQFNPLSNHFLKVKDSFLLPPYVNELHFILIRVRDPLQTTPENTMFKS